MILLLLYYRYAIVVLPLFMCKYTYFFEYSNFSPLEAKDPTPAASMPRQAANARGETVAQRMQRGRALGRRGAPLSGERSEPWRTERVGRGRSDLGREAARPGASTAKRRTQAKTERAERATTGHRARPRPQAEDATPKEGTTQRTAARSAGGGRGYGGRAARGAPQIKQICERSEHPRQAKMLAIRLAAIANSGGRATTPRKRVS